MKRTPLAPAVMPLKLAVALEPTPSTAVFPVGDRVSIISSASYVGGGADPKSP